MKKYKWFLFTVALIALSLLACRPEIKNEAPVEPVRETVPAQVATPAPTPTPTPSPAPTPTPTSTPTPTTTPVPTPIKIPPLPPGVKILTPMPVPSGVDMSPPKPPPHPPQSTLPKTAEEAEALGLGIIQTLSGPATKGAKINIGKTIIKLPEDAYVDYWISSVDCLVGARCIQAPVYGIRRGKSTIAFSSVNGEVSGEEIAIGEIGAFDFLKDYLKRKTPSPTTAPVLPFPVPSTTGPDTKGAQLQIGGNDIKLPDDAYLDAIIVSVYRFLDKPTPKVPIYRVVQGKSFIEFSAVDGEMVQERPAPLEEGIIDSLKGSLGLKWSAR